MGRFLKVLAMMLIIACGVSAQTWEIGSLNAADVIATLTADGTMTISGTGNWSWSWSSVRRIITKLIIEDGVTNIGAGAFSACSSLTSVTIGNSVMSIGDHAFADCIGLTSVTIPNSVTHIGAGAFVSCIGLTSVTIPNSVTNIGDNAFLGCIGLTDINVSPDNANFSSGNGVLFNKDKTTLIKYPAGKQGASYTIPNSVTSIGEYAFYGCIGLTSVTIPANVTNIGQAAFFNCRNLTEIISLNPTPQILPIEDDGWGTLTPFYYYVPRDPWFTIPSITIYVPAGSVNAYRNAAVWKIFNILSIEERPQDCSDGHSYGAPVVIEATCEAEGSSTRTCSVCGHEDIEPIEKLGHDFPDGCETTCRHNDCEVKSAKCGECAACNATSISNIKKSSDKMLFKQTIVSDKMEITLDGRVSFVVYDMTGNVVFNGNGRTWDLRNSAGRFVANGTYLVIAEVRGASGKVYAYSARLGVKR